MHNRMILKLRIARKVIQAHKDVSVGCYFDTSPDLGGQNVLKTFEMANRPTTRTELEGVLSVAVFIFPYVQKYFAGLLSGTIAPRVLIRHLQWRSNGVRKVQGPPLAGAPSSRQNFLLYGRLVQVGETFNRFVDLGQ